MISKDDSHRIEALELLVRRQQTEIRRLTQRLDRLDPPGIERWIDLPADSDIASETCDDLPAIARRLWGLEPSQYEAILAITKTIFDGPIQVALEHDPEIIGESYLVFDVEDRGEYKEVAARRLRWHRETESIAPQLAFALRLAIDIQS